MNTLGNSEKRNKATILATLTVATLLQACGNHNDRNYRPDHPQVSEPEISSPDLIEDTVYIDFNINNATLAFVDEETWNTIPWLDSINTDSEWKAHFSLPTLQAKLQSIGNKRMFIIPVWIEANYSSTIDLTNGKEHIITDFSNGIGKILKSNDVYNAVNSEIEHSAASLTYFRSSTEWYPQEVEYDLGRFNKAVSRVFWNYTADINHDWVTNSYDINENTEYSNYAERCLTINPDWSLTVNFIPADDLYSRMWK
jgi:hypothetical protein